MALAFTRNHSPADMFGAQQRGMEAKSPEKGAEGGGLPNPGFLTFEPTIL